MSFWLSFCLPGYVMYPCTYMYIPDNWAYAYHTILLTYANLKQSSGNSSGRHLSHRTRTPWHSARQSYTSLMPKCWRRHHNYRGQCRSVGTSCVFFWVLFWGWVIVRTGNCVGCNDVFRFMDRVRVPIHHELKKAYFYFYSLSEAFLAWDDTALRTVKDALREKFRSHHDCVTHENTAPITNSALVPM